MAKPKEPPKATVKPLNQNQRQLEREARLAMGWIPYQLQVLEGKGLVHEGLLPPFSILPEVVHFGIRTFALYSKPTEDNEYALYREVFAWSVVDL